MCLLVATGPFTVCNGIKFRQSLVYFLTRRFVLSKHEVKVPASMQEQQHGTVL